MRFTFGFLSVWVLSALFLVGCGSEAALCEGVVCEDDGNECTNDVCNPATGTCRHVTVEDDTPCDFDGLPGLCQAGVCVNAMPCEGVVCQDDGNECTDEACNPSSGSCENTPVHDGTACADGRGGCYGGLCNFVPLVVSTGPKETVFEWTVDRCDAGDASPDGPAQAVRTADGDLVLFSGNPWLIRGPDFDHLVTDCTGPALESAMLPTPQSYENGEWLWSPYREGAKWHVLIHNEFHDALARTCDPGNPFPGNPCWYNSITYGVSTDDAHSFVKPGAPAHVIAPPPSQWVAPPPDLPRGGYMEGHFMPSSIVRGLDGYYYALMLAIPSYLTGASGVCAMRTQTLGDPTSWRAWDGTAFNLRMESPYATEVTSPACQLLPRPPGRSWSLLLTHNLTYNTYVQRHMLLTDGDPVGGQRECGIYASLSTDLVHWSDTQLVVQADSLSAGPCYLDPRGPDPIEPAGILVHYPSIIDHADSTINFDRPGQTPYLYYTRASDWPGPDRDIVRVPLTFTMIGGPRCEGVNCDDQNACTEDICIGADGSCEHTPIGCAPDFNDCTTDICDPASGCTVPDETPCAGGICQAGACQLSGSVLPCTEQGVRNAIAAGGGPYKFNCDGMGPIVTQAEIVIDNDVSLDGEGRLTLDGNGSHRVLSVPAGVAAELIGITVTGGSTAEGGGGIQNLGTLILADSVVSGNTARFGGGVRNEGQADLINATVSNNFATQAAGGVSTRPRGTMTLTGCTVQDNVAVGDVGGISSAGGTLELSDTTVSGNEAAGQAGGIRNAGGGTLTVMNSTVSGNQSGDMGGGIVNEAMLTLSDSTISFNSAGAHGGGIFNSGTLIIMRSTIAENTGATSGGGIENYSGLVDIESSTVSGNTATTGGGGAIENPFPAGTLSLTNTTVSGNSSIGRGAIENAGVAVVTSSTLSLNVTDGTVLWDDSGPVTFRNTIIEGVCTRLDPSAVDSLGGNIESPGNTCGLSNPTDLFFVPSVGLEPLEDNGGPTMTHALLPGSVAIDVPGAMCVDAEGQPLTADQRGELRPAGPGCDAGAFELQP